VDDSLVHMVDPNVFQRLFPLISSIGWSIWLVQSAGSIGWCTRLVHVVDLNVSIGWFDWLVYR
jgi:hypothetical protein